MAAPTWVAANHQVFGSRTSGECAKPTGKESKDILFAIPWGEGKASKKFTITSTGLTWTEAIAQKEWLGVRFGLFWAVDDGSTNNVKMEWEGSEAQSTMLLVFSARGAHQTTPVKDISAWTERASSKELLGPPVTPTAAQTLVFDYMTTVTSTDRETAPPGWTERQHNEASFFANFLATKEGENGVSSGEALWKWAAATQGLGLSWTVQAAPSEASPPAINFFGPGALRWMQLLRPPPALVEEVVVTSEEANSLTMMP